jgi:glucose/arabinose dehydrogenase
LRTGEREVTADRPLPGVRWQVVAGTLSEPLDLAASSDGHLFYTERTKGLSVLRPDGSRQLVFSPDDLWWNAGQGGLFGVAVDPGFPWTRRVFVFMTAKAGEHAEARVVRLTLDERLQQVKERKDIVTGIAVPAIPRGRSGEPLQLGGALRFGGELLYVGLGDARSATGPQSAALLHGKVLRIDRDGNPAGGNRAPKGFDARIFAYGFRNPVALAVNPRSQDLMVAENGPGRIDALVRTGPGGNGGWDPRCTAAAESYCGTSRSGPGQTAAAGSLQVQPAGAADEGLSSASFLSGRFLWDWSGALALTFNEGRRIDLLKLNHLGQVTRRGTLLRQAGVGFRAITQLQDEVYVMTSGKAGGDEIWRLTFQ